MTGATGYTGPTGPTIYVSIPVQYISVSGNFTISSAHANNFNVFSITTSITITVEDYLGITGNPDFYFVNNTSTTVSVTLSSGGGSTLLIPSSYTTAQNYTTIHIKRIGTNLYIVV